jgi:hypothetical protein
LPSRTPPWEARGFPLDIRTTCPGWGRQNDSRRQKVSRKTIVQNLVVIVDGKSFKAS